MVSSHPSSLVLSSPFSNYHFSKLMQPLWRAKAGYCVMKVFHHIYNQKEEEETNKQIMSGRKQMCWGIWPYKIRKGHFLLPTSTSHSHKQYLLKHCWQMGSIMMWIFWMFGMNHIFKLLKKKAKSNWCYCTAQLWANTALMNYAYTHICNLYSVHIQRLS